LSFILAVAVWSPALADHTVDSIFKNNDWDVNIWGYANISGEPGKDFMSYPTRIRTTVKYKEHWLAFTEVDVSHFFQSNAPYNPITQAWIGYNFGKTDNIFSDVMIRAGSILTSGGLYLPPAYMAVTAVSPTNPFGHYATGIQVSKVWKDFTFTADFTGASERSIQDPKRMSRFETSQRFDWNVMKNEKGKTALQLSLFNAWSADAYHRIGLGVKYRPFDDLGLYAGMFKSQEHLSDGRTENEIGGYVLADYNLFKFRDDFIDFDVRPHIMFEKTGGTKDYTGYTGGVSFVLPEDGTYGRLNGSKISVDLMNTTTQIENGPKVTDHPIMLNFRIFF